MKTIDVNALAALVRAHARQELEEHRVGLKEVVVHQNGRCVYREFFGANDTPQKPVLFRAASMTKPITTAAVMQLVDRGLLDLNDPVARFYPQMKQMQVATVKDGRITALRPAQNEIRVADLLCHTSGVGSEPVLSALQETTVRLPLDEALPLIAAQPLAFEPRKAQSYSPTDAFDLAAGIVEAVAGLPFDEYLKRSLFEPLNMVDTTFAPSEEQWTRMAPMHERTEQGLSATAALTEHCVFNDMIPARMAAGAGLATTADDYCRFAEMLCRGGTAPDGAPVLTAASVAQMASPHVPESIMPGSERWGLGMRVVVGSDYQHGLGVGCFGWSGAYGTHFWVDPQNRISVVMMKNSLYDGGAGNRSACTLERDVAACLR